MTDRIASPAASGRPSLRWFYLGALVGPYGGSTASVLLTTFRDDFAIDLQTASLSISFYMLAYSLCLIFSGTLSDTFGSRLAVTTGCTLLGLGSILCAVAPTFEVLLAGRTLQGVGNAFTTALLMASLGELVPSHRLGSSLGVFAAFQMAGATFGPLGGGLAAAVNWRLNFLVLALLSAFLAWSCWRFFTLTGVGVHGKRVNPLGVARRVISPRLGLLCLAAFVGYLGAPSLAALAAVHLEQVWGLAPSVTGLVLAGFGLVNVFAAPKAGRWVDRFGRWRMILAGTLIATGLVVIEAFMPSAFLFSLVFILLGLPVVLSWTALGTLAIEAFPRERGTAIAIFSSAKFGGVAVAPALLLPIYLAAGPVPAFLTAAAATLLLIVPIFLYQRLPVSSD